MQKQTRIALIFLFFIINSQISLFALGLPCKTTGTFEIYPFHYISSQYQLQGNMSSLFAEERDVLEFNIFQNTEFSFEVNFTLALMLQFLDDLTALTLDFIYRINQTGFTFEIFLFNQSSTNQSLFSVKNITVNTIIYETEQIKLIPDLFSTANETTQRQIFDSIKGNQLLRVLFNFSLPIDDILFSLDKLWITSTINSPDCNKFEQFFEVIEEPCLFAPIRNKSINILTENINEVQIFEREGRINGTWKFNDSQWLNFTRPEPLGGNSYLISQFSLNRIIDNASEVNELEISYSYRHNNTVSTQIRFGFFDQRLPSSDYDVRFVELASTTANNANQILFTFIIRIIPDFYPTVEDALVDGLFDVDSNDLMIEFAYLFTKNINKNLQIAIDHISMKVEINESNIDNFKQWFDLAECEEVPIIENGNGNGNGKGLPTDLEGITLISIDLNPILVILLVILILAFVIFFSKSPQTLPKRF